MLIAIKDAAGIANTIKVGQMNDGDVDYVIRPAPCLTKLWVSFIKAELGPNENPSPDETHSKYGHSGSNWMVETSELGYGNNPIVELARMRLARLAARPIVDPSGLVIGFIYRWGYSGPFLSGGTLWFHDESTNRPCQWPGRNSMDVSFEILPWEGARD